MKRISAASGKAWLTARSDTMLHLTWEPSVDISEADALSVLEISAEMVNEKPYTVLVDMTTIVNLSPDARAAFNADSRVIAAALLGDGPMDRVLAAGAQNAVHPTGFFTTQAEALSWLTAHAVQHPSATEAMAG